MALARITALVQQHSQARTFQLPGALRQFQTLENRIFGIPQQKAWQVAGMKEQRNVQLQKTHSPSAEHAGIQSQALPLPGINTILSPIPALHRE